MPFAEKHDELAGCGRNNGQDHENHHDERHDLGHLTPGELVANDGYGDHARGSSAKPLQDTQDDKRREIGDDGRSQSCQNINDEPGEQRQPAAEAVAQGAVEELRNAKPEQIGSDHELDVVFRLNAEACTDLRQAGQHDVDRQRIDGHDRRDERDEFAASTHGSLLVRRTVLDVERHDWHSLAKWRIASRDTIRKTKFRKQKQTDENLSLQHLEHFQQKCEAVLRRIMRRKNT